MDQNVRKMLESMHDLLTEKFHDPHKAWDHFIDFLAVDNCGSLIYQLDHKFEWLFEDGRLADRLMKTYDPEKLRSDYYDHLGEMYLDKVVGPSQVQRQGLFLTPMHVADSMAAMTMGETKDKVNVLDPCVGTGRLLMAAHKQAPNARLFGVDVDLRALRVAFTNFAIHDISGYLLHADSLGQETDISTDDGLHNWQFANRWYSCMDKLKPIKGSSSDKSTTPRKEKEQISMFGK